MKKASTPKKANPKAEGKPKPPAKKTAGKQPAKKTAKVAAGSKTTTTQTLTVNRKTQIPAQATVLLSDAQFAADVIEKLKEAFEAKIIVEAFEEMLTATTENKHGEITVDHRTRLAALEKIVHLIVGKPIDRVQNIETTVWTVEQLEEMIGDSPMMRLALREMLAPYDAEDGIKPDPAARQHGRPR